MINCTKSSSCSYPVGGNGKLRIYLKGDVRKYEYDLPFNKLKKKLPNVAVASFKSEPPIRQQLLLARQIQKMLENNKAKDLKKIAGWMNVSKSRLEQISNLLFLFSKNSRRCHYLGTQLTFQDY